MAKKKKQTDRHKPSRMMRIVERLAKQLEKLAETNATNATQEANRLIREGLERAKLWPPEPGGKKAPPPSPSPD